MASGTQNMTTDKARLLSTTGGTTKFWRGDNSWSNTLTGTLNLTAGSGTPLSITGAGGKIFAFKLSNGAQNMDIGWEYSPLTGSGAAFRSKDDTAGPGEFLIYARSDSGTVQLWGKPNGVLTWGGNRIPVANSSGNAGSQYAPVYSKAGVLTEITAGTSAQFYRGDKTWSNILAGPLNIDTTTNSGTQNTHKLYVNGDSAFEGKIAFGTAGSNAITNYAYLQWNSTDKSIDFVFV